MNQTLLGERWWEILEKEFSKSYMESLRAFLLNEYQNKSVVIYPEPINIFRALKICQPEDVKVVIIGQDPYHNGQADGLAFSSNHSFSRPKSLQVIFKEINNQYYKGEEDRFMNNFQGHDLSTWASQGVLLLNSCLTVRSNQPKSHQGKGWEQFITVVLSYLLADPSPKVFITWGNNATNVLAEVVDGREIVHHKWLSSGHPATVLYNRDTFTGNKHFIKTNEFLKSNGKGEIDWRVQRKEVGKSE